MKNQEHCANFRRTWANIAPRPSACNSTLTAQGFCSVSSLHQIPVVANVACALPLPIDTFAVLAPSPLDDGLLGSRADAPTLSLAATSAGTSPQSPVRLGDSRFPF